MIIPSPIPITWIHQQTVEDIYQLQPMLFDLAPRLVIELGIAEGGTALLWAKIVRLCGGGKVIGVDRGWPHYGPKVYWGTMFESMIIEIEGNTSDMVPIVAELLEGRKADFMFIDADHTPRGVESDFDLYRHFVRTGGLIAFHDIACVEPYVNVKPFWDRVKDFYPHKEVITNPVHHGIGVITYDEGIDYQRVFFERDLINEVPVPQEVEERLESIRLAVAKRSVKEESNVRGISGKEESRN